MKAEVTHLIKAGPIRTVKIGQRQWLVGLIVLTLFTATLQALAGAQSSTLRFQQSNLVVVGLGLGWLGLVFIISLQRPVILVHAAVFFVFFTAWRPVDLFVGSLQASQLLVVLALIGVLVRGVYVRGRVAGIRVPLLLLLLLAVVIVGALQTALIDVDTMGLPIMREGRANPFIRGISGVIALAIGMCAFVAVARLLKTMADVRIALQSWLAGAVFTIMAGVYMYAQYYWTALPTLPAVLLGDNGYGIHVRDAAALAASDDYVLRISAFAMEPRHLTYLLAPLVSFLSVYLLLLRGMSAVSRRRLLWATGVVVIGFALTSSRTTYILIVVIAGIVLWTTRHRFLVSPQVLIRALVLIILGTGLMLGIFGFVSHRNPLEFIRLQLQSLEQVEVLGSGVSQAIDGVRVAWRMFLSNPFFGRGWGSYVYFTQAYGFESAFAPNPNNLYLLMLAETGLFGLAILLLILWRGLRMAFAPLPTAEAYHPLLAALGAALLATYACFMFWDTIQYTHLWMLLGLVQAARVAAKREAECVSV